MSFNVIKSETRITYVDGVNGGVKDLIPLSIISWAIPTALTNIEKIRLLRNINPGLALLDAKNIIELDEPKVEKPIFIKTVPVQSDVIASIGYDYLSQLLIVVFRNGIAYTYPDFPEDSYRVFIHSTSKGKYFNKHIKHYGNYGQTEDNLLQK